MSSPDPENRDYQQLLTRPGRRRLAQAIYDRLPAEMQIRAMRVQLAWQRRRRGFRHPIDIGTDENGYIVDDGLRAIRVQDFRQATEYQRGISVKIDEVAAKYGAADGLRISQGAVVIDVGANVGEFSLWCADSEATLYAMEPDPRAYRCLEANLGSLPNAILIPMAAWNFEKTVHFYTPETGGHGSLFEPPELDFERGVVDAMPIDAIQSLSTMPRVDLIKISAAGAEPEILQGARKTLRVTGLVIVDVTSNRRPNLRHRVAATLESLNFAIHSEAMSDIIVAANRGLTPGLVQYPRF